MELWKEIEQVPKEIPLGFSKVILVLEARGPEHFGEIKKGLKKEGYPFEMLKSQQRLPVFFMI